MTSSNIRAGNSYQKKNKSSQNPTGTAAARGAALATSVKETKWKHTKTSKASASVEGSSNDSDLEVISSATLSTSGYRHSGGGYQGARDNYKPKTVSYSGPARQAARPINNSTSAVAIRSSPTTVYGNYNDHSTHVGGYEPPGTVARTNFVGDFAQNLNQALNSNEQYSSVRGTIYQRHEYTPGPSGYGQGQNRYGQNGHSNGSWSTTTYGSFEFRR